METRSSSRTLSKPSSPSLRLLSFFDPTTSYDGCMKIDGALITGVYTRRLNRFLASVSLNGRAVQCFLPNPGRMEELLVPRVKVVLREAEGKHRKTHYDLLAVYQDDLLVCLDTRIPNRLLFEAFKESRLDAFSQYNIIKPEYVYGQSRFDFLLRNNRERCLIEAKSCTLVKHRVALFPDAPTRRGRRHVSELAQARQEGYRACVIFIIQRTDVDAFSPNDATDPAFGAALRQASAEGVELYAYSSDLTENEVLLRTRIRINLRTSKSVTTDHYVT